jgi:arylesterase / paraoxonase
MVSPVSAPILLLAIKRREAVLSKDIILMGNRLGHFNISARNLKDGMYVMDINAPGGYGSDIKHLSTGKYSGTLGDKALDLHGFHVSVSSRPGSALVNLHLLLVNHRPPVDTVAGEYLDATKVGANSTIEVFDVALGKSEMTHRKTIAHELIQTPNRVVATGEGGMLITNDKSAKLGLVMKSLLTKIPWRCH